MKDAKQLQQLVGGTIKEIRMSDAHGEVIYLKLEDGRHFYIASQSAHEVGVGIINGDNFTEL